MEQENEELEMQNNSNNIFDNFVNGIEEHPKEAGVCILGLLAALGITNFIQWRKNRKEQKRHEEVEILEEADKFVVGECEIESIFTEEELQQNKEAIRLMNEEFNQIHHLDKVDVAIGALAGMVGAAVDILMVGIPEKTPEGLKAGPLSNYIRDYFDRKFPEEEMQKLANSKESKVPFDAQDNRHTTIRVEGLSAYYHPIASYS